MIQEFEALTATNPAPINQRIVPPALLRSAAKTWTVNFSHTASQRDIHIQPKFLYDHTDPIEALPSDLVVYCMEKVDPQLVWEKLIDVAFSQKTRMIAILSVIPPKDPEQYKILFNIPKGALTTSRRLVMPGEIKTCDDPAIECLALENASKEDTMNTLLDSLIKAREKYGFCI